MHYDQQDFNDNMVMMYNGNTHGWGGGFAVEMKLQIVLSPEGCYQTVEVTDRFVSGHNSNSRLLPSIRKSNRGVKL